MTEPPSQGTHSPAVPAYILRGHTSLALLPSFSSPATQMAVWSSPPSEAKNNARSWIRTKDLFITSETLSRRCQRWRIWIEQTYTPKPNGLVLRPENEPFSRLPQLFLLVISCFLQALSRGDGTCPLTSHTHEPPSKPLTLLPLSLFQVDFRVSLSP